MATYKAWNELEKDDILLQVSQQHQSGSGSSTYNMPLSLALKPIIEPLQKGIPYWNPENDKWLISYPKEEAVKAELEAVKAELEAVKAELEAVKAELGPVKAELEAFKFSGMSILGFVLLVTLCKKMEPAPTPAP